MNQPRVQRRLPAILAADVVGYSRLVEADEAGTVARLTMRIVCESGETIDPPQYGILELAAMCLELKAAGGSGWGNPLERDPEVVLRDVRDEVVSPEVDRSAYGVAIDDSGRRLDLAETEKLRA